ncbi:MAG: Asp-tRNA(Asn)/Glu-tRNA(Gln) amidotransferase GatCAB subunit C [Gammaproteobacteria bacterium]|nr:MAG: Asp-tRNA(Asn)/Glu-tRNA(Gln) amidotransferase GatCAB subunit C [Gammaproteobacteria bacterium]
MALDNNEVAKIAHLARIKMDDSKAPEYADSLSSILDLVEQLQAADTSNIEPMAHPMDATQRLRPDEITETNQREAYQAVAPATEDGLFLVPKVIE